MVNPQEERILAWKLPVLEHRHGVEPGFVGRYLYRLRAVAYPHPALGGAEARCRRNALAHRLLVAEAVALEEEPLPAAPSVGRLEPEAIPVKPRRDEGEYPRPERRGLEAVDLQPVRDGNLRRALGDRIPLPEHAYVDGALDRDDDALAVFVYLDLGVLEVGCLLAIARRMDEVSAEKIRPEAYILVEAVRERADERHIRNAGK